MESWNILEILPPEVMILVFSNLEPEDIVSSLSVSKLWNALHNGFNWKEAFLMTFGELSSSSVDVTRKFNWRKLFFDRKTLSAMGKRIKIKEMLKFSYIPKKYIYLRAVTKDNVIYSIEENFYNIDLRLLKQDPAISKDKLIPSTATLSSATFHFITSNNKHNNLIIDFSGHFSTNELPYVRMFVFWHLKKGVKALPSLVLPDGIPKRCYNGDNRIFQSAKYILLHDRPHGCLIDTSKRCYHYCDVQKKGQIYEREMFPTTCENKEKCAIIDTWFEYYWYPFLSVEDPDLVVGIRGKEKDFVLVISRIGQEQKIEINLAKVITNLNQVKIGSEHVIRSRKKIVKHWFSFEINNELYFIDLMDPTRRVKTAVVSKYDWIPNESKVVLQNKNILIVFDLETATRCSKLTFKRGSNIMDFSILPNRGFIAALENNGNTVSICQWETAAQARSIDVSEYHARSVKFISDNVLLVYNDTWMSYIKL